MVTPHESYPKLAEAIGVPELYFKREDLHPYGSHKGRSIPRMIEHYSAQGDTRFAIASSGNAAFAAALYIKEVNSKVPTPLELDIYVGNHIAPAKLRKIQTLEDHHIRVFTKERPLQALTQATNDGVRSLRQSTDDEALVGYEALAEEIAAIKNIGAVFIGTSSGTTAQALATYFIKKKLNIQVHIVQTSSCHVMADAFDTFDIPPETSIADAIVDQTAFRKAKLTPLIEKTGGRGWCALNNDIESAQDLAAKHAHVDISTNSALSVVGAMQAAYMGYEIGGAVVCIICGD